MNRVIHGVPASALVRASLLAGTLAMMATSARAIARPAAPTQAEGAYALVATWSDVGAATRVVAGGDGFIYVLNDQGVRRTNPDGTLNALIPGNLPALQEIAVDGTGTVYGASGGDVRRLAANGRAVWSVPVLSDSPSILVPYVSPYVAALAFDGTSNVTLLYDSYRGDYNHTWTRNYALGNGVDAEGPALLFPENSYWDIDYAGGKAYILNRTTTLARTWEQVEIYQGLSIANEAPIPLPAQASRIAMGPGGMLFAVSERRWVYALKANAAGDIVDVWNASDPSPIGSASIVTDVAVDAGGHVYVTDPAHKQVRVYARQPGLQRGELPRTGNLAGCQLVPNKTADPNYLRLGEATKVTLTLGGDCPPLVERADIVLLMDRSNSMNYENGTKIVAARAGAEAFANMVDTARDQLSLVTFQSDAEMRVPLTHDRTSVINAIRAIQAEGGTDIAKGINVAVDELTGPHGRHDPQTRPIIVLLTDGVAFNSTRLTTVAAADRARDAGITMFTIGLGTDVEPDLLRVLARTPDLYFDVPDAAKLQGIYEQIGKYIQALVLLKTVTIVDYIPRNMKFLPSMPAIPPPVFDAAANTLTWTFDRVAFSGIQMSYWLEPLEVGTWPTNVQAIYTGKDGFDKPQNGPFPIPKVVVWAPTQTPPASGTVPPSPTPTRTTAAPPSVTSTSTPPPTVTRRPSATSTLTPTVTRTPVPPTVGPTPTPTATPSGHRIYLTILFNDQCFKRFSDTVLVLDASTTMLERGDDGRLKLDAAKAAARAFMDKLEFTPDPTGRQDQVSIVWFNDTAKVQQGLTNDRQALEDALNAIQPVQGSRLDLGLLEAHKELMLSEYRILANNPAIVFLSDGIPNRTTVDAVIHEADAAKLDAISVFTVGFGTDVRHDVMRRIASQPEMYYPAATSGDLAKIYAKIAGDLVCR